MVVGGEDGGVHDAGKTGDDGGDAEDDGEAPFDVDAEELDGGAVLHAGADDHAVGGVAEEGEDGADDGEGEEQVDETPPRVDEVFAEAEQLADRGGAGEGFGGGHGDGVGAVEGFDDFL